MAGHTPHLEEKKKKKQGEMPLPILSPSPKFYNCQQNLV